MRSNMITKEQAIAFYESKAWEDMSARARAEFQLLNDRLCMPFDVYHKAMEETLGRPVYSHEFGMNIEGLMAELFGGATPPNLDDILEMIPTDKRMFIVVPEA